MVERNVAFARDAMSGELMAGDAAAVWRSVAIDSRKIAGGEIFFALPGEATDGHRFVGDAVMRGAAAVVVHEDSDVAGETARLRVADTYRALHDLTRAVRAEVPRSLVAITGSMGKTTTKELLAVILARRFRVAKSRGNLNNLYGFPLSLLAIPDDCEWMVAEMGMSTPGELRQISLLGQPEVAVFTNVRAVHLENFPDVRGIAEAKAELLAGLAPGGTVIANSDDPEVMGLVARAGLSRRAGLKKDGVTGRLVRFGFDEEAEVQGSDLRSGSTSSPIGCRFRVTAGGESEDFELRVHGLYNAENCLAAAACAHTLGMPLSEIATAVAAFEPAGSRGAVEELSAGLTLIDDSYNSNPRAAVKALESARQLPAERYVAILGDMLELGAAAAGFHREVGERAAELGFTVVGVGELAGELASAARARGTAAQDFEHATAAAQWALAALASNDLRRGDLVLVKGSRGIGLERVVEALRAGVDEGGQC